MKKQDDDTANAILPNTHTGFGSASRRPSISALSGDFSTATGSAIVAVATAIGMAAAP